MLGPPSRESVGCAICRRQLCLGLFDAEVIYGSVSCCEQNRKGVDICTDREASASYSTANSDRNGRDVYEENLSRCRRPRPGSQPGCSPRTRSRPPPGEEKRSKGTSMLSRQDIDF